MLHKLFECIRTEMRKGSPEGYNAENGIHNRLGNLKQEISTNPIGGSLACASREKELVTKEVTRAFASSVLAELETRRDQALA